VVGRGTGLDYDIIPLSGAGRVGIVIATSGGRRRPGRPRRGQGPRLRAALRAFRPRTNKGRPPRRISLRKARRVGLPPRSARPRVTAGGFAATRPANRFPMTTGHMGYDGVSPQRCVRQCGDNRTAPLLIVFFGRRRWPSWRWKHKGSFDARGLARGKASPRLGRLPGGGPVISPAARVTGGAVNRRC